MPLQIIQKKKNEGFKRTTGLDPLKVRDQTINQLRQQTRQHLLASTGDPSWRARSDATQALVAVCEPGEDAAVDVLGLKLADVHASVRVVAIDTLGVICPAHFSEQFPDVTETLRKTLKDESRFVREKAAAVLSVVSTGDPGTIRDLVKATNDPEPMVRVAAISSLGLLAPVNDQYVIRAIAARMHMAEDETAAVLEAVHIALSVLQDKTGERQQAAKLNIKEQLKREAGKSQKDIDADYTAGSALQAQERMEQATLVELIKDADSLGMFDKNYKIKSTTDQRKHRYAKRDLHHP
jgi:HEAT repeat protein